jgi:putative ABC transport system permease protein
MKFLPLIWSGLWRKPARTLLTAASIAIAFLLIGLLQGVNAGFDTAIAKARRDYLMTDARVRGSPPMPIAMLEQIKKVPGVVAATQRAYFVADYRPPYGIAAIATEPERFFELRPNLASNAEALEAMRRTRNGMLATPPLLKMFDWKIGDAVTVRSRELKQDGSGDWEFVIVGVFDAVETPTDTALAVINYAYLDGARVANRGTVERFYVRIADPNRSVITANAIDRLFENSSYPTRTRSDQERAEADTRQMGDIAFFTNAIVAAVLFTLLFLTGNTMRQSIEERLGDFAVLKAVGFSDEKCFGFALLEAVAIFTVAAIAGLALAAAIAPLAREVSATIAVSWSVVIQALLLAILLALVSVALPSWRLYRLSVIAALGRR